MKTIEHKKYNPNRIHVGDRVTVSNSSRYTGRVLRMKLDKKNKKVMVYLHLDDPSRASTVDASDCYPLPRILYPGHHNNVY